MLIKDISTIQTGLFAKPSGKGEVVYLQSKHFDENGQIQTELYSDLMAEGISQKHLLQEGDVLFAAKGTKNFAAIYEFKNKPAVASTSFFVIRPKDKKVLSKYLAWFLNQTHTQRILKDKARGTAIPSITKNVLEDLEIPIPSIEKQKIIIELASLVMKEFELRNSILEQRKLFVENQILKSI